MKSVFEPWLYAARGLVLRTAGGPRTPNVPVPPPPGLEPPEALPDAENGYVALAALVANWPPEGVFPPDLPHRLQALPGDRKAAEQALTPLRSLLDGFDGLPPSARWQATAPESGAWPELARLRRLAHALLLRGALEGRADEPEKVTELARRLRQVQGPFIHFLVGVAMERSAGGDLKGVAEDRAEAVRWELARFAIPRAHRIGPWEPVDYDSPPAWTDARRSVQWALAGHPAPYDPAATVAALVGERELMAKGTAEALRARADEYGAPWPEGMRRLGGFGPGHASLADLRRARIALSSTENPYGRLSVAQTLRSAANLAAAVEAAS